MTTIRLRRGTEAQILAVTGRPEGEPYYSTDTEQLFVVDETGVPQPVGTPAPAVMTGATGGTAGAAGLVPAPAAGDQNKVLRGDATWGAAGGERSTATYTTASLAAGATESSGTVTLPPSAAILRLATDHPARVRLYLSDAYRTADLARNVAVDPSGDHGCVLEVVTTAGVLALRLSPVAMWGGVGSGTTGYLTITNDDSVSRAITVDLDVLSMEG